MHNGYRALTTFRERLLSKSQLVLLLVACAFPIHIWSYLNILNETAAQTISLSMLDLAGTIAYTLTFTLVETGLIFICFLGIFTLLSTKFLRRDLVILTTLWLWTTAFWLALFHYQNYKNRVVEEVEPTFLILWIISYLLMLGLANYSFRKWAIVRQYIERLLEKLTVLTFIYLFVDLISIIIVFSRNLL